MDIGLGSQVGNILQLQADAAVGHDLVVGKAVGIAGRNRPVAVMIAELGIAVGFVCQRAAVEVGVCAADLPGVALGAVEQIGGQAIQIDRDAGLAVGTGIAVAGEDRGGLCAGIGLGGQVGEEAAVVGAGLTLADSIGSAVGVPGVAVGDGAVVQTDQCGTGTGGIGLTQFHGAFIGDNKARGGIACDGAQGDTVADGGLVGDDKERGSLAGDRQVCVAAAQVSGGIMAVNRGHDALADGVAFGSDDKASGGFLGGDAALARNQALMDGGAAGNGEARGIPAGNGDGVGAFAQIDLTAQDGAIQAFGKACGIAAGGGDGAGDGHVHIRNGRDVAGQHGTGEACGSGGTLDTVQMDVGVGYTGCLGGTEAACSHIGSNGTGGDRHIGKGHLAGLTRDAAEGGGGGGVEGYIGSQDGIARDAAHKAAGDGAVGCKGVDVCADDLKGSVCGMACNTAGIGCVVGRQGSEFHGAVFDDCGLCGLVAGGCHTAAAAHQTACVGGGKGHAASPDRAVFDGATLVLACQQAGVIGGGDGNIAQGQVHIGDGALVDPCQEACAAGAGDSGAAVMDIQILYGAGDGAEEAAGLGLEAGQPGLGQITAAAGIGSGEGIDGDAGIQGDSGVQGSIDVQLLDVGNTLTQNAVQTAHVGEVPGGADQNGGGRVGLSGGDGDIAAAVIHRVVVRRVHLGHGCVGIEVEDVSGGVALGGDLHIEFTCCGLYIQVTVRQLEDVEGMGRGTVGGVDGAGDGQVPAEAAHLHGDGSIGGFLRFRGVGDEDDIAVLHHNGVVGNGNVVAVQGEVDGGAVVILLIVSKAGGNRRLGPVAVVGQTLDHGEGIGLAGVFHIIGVGILYSGLAPAVGGKAFAVQVDVGTGQGTVLVKVSRVQLSVVILQLLQRADLLVDPAAAVLMLGGQIDQGFVTLAGGAEVGVFTALSADIQIVVA